MLPLRKRMIEDLQVALRIGSTQARSHRRAEESRSSSSPRYPPADPRVVGKLVRISASARMFTLLARAKGAVAVFIAHYNYCAGGGSALQPDGSS